MAKLFSNGHANYTSGHVWNDCVTKFSLNSTSRAHWEAHKVGKWWKNRHFYRRFFLSRRRSGQLFGHYTPTFWLHHQITLSPAYPGATLILWQVDARPNKRPVKSPKTGNFQSPKFPRTIYPMFFAYLMRIFGVRIGVAMGVHHAEDGRAAGWAKGASPDFVSGGVDSEMRSNGYKAWKTGSEHVREL